MTMRDSIRTWRTGMSILAISAWISSSLDGMSVTNSWFVRVSNTTAPRGERIRDALPDDPPVPVLWPVMPVGDVLHLRVVELERLRAHRLERGDLLLRLQLDLLLGVQLVLRRDQDDVARLAQAEVLGLQDDVERLVPGHVLQAQRDVAGDGVAGDDVEVGEVGDDLQQRPDLDVLEVERELLAGVACALDELVRVDLLGAHLEHELVVALVGAVLPGTARFDDHADAVALLRRRDALHRRAEIGDVEATTQVVGQARAEELDHQALALLADVDADLVVRQLDDDPTGAVGAAAEVDVAQRQLIAIEAFGEARGLPARARQRGRRVVVERDDQHLAVDLRAVAGRRLEVQHQARALAGLGDADRAQVALVDLDRRLAEPVGDAGQVDARCAAAPGP